MVHGPRALLVKKYTKYVIISSLLLLMILAYLGRGFIRETLVPSMVLLAHSSSLSSATSDAKTEVQSIYPFGHIRYIKEYQASCELSDAHYFKTEVYCSTYLFRGQSLIKGMPVEEFDVKSQRFETALNEKGWSSTRQYSGLIRSYGQPYEWWYLVEYKKTYGKYDCKLTVQRDDDPSLLDAGISCDRRVTFF